MGRLICKDHSYDEWTAVGALHSRAKIILTATPLFLFLVIAPILQAIPNLVDVSSGISLFDWQRLYSCSALAGTALFIGLYLGVYRKDLCVSQVGFGLFLYCFASGVVAIYAYPEAQREAWREWLLLYFPVVICCFYVQQTEGFYQEFVDLVTGLVIGTSLCYLMWVLVLNHTINWMEIPFESFLLPGFPNVRMLNDWQSFVLPFFVFAITHYCSNNATRAITFILASIFCAFVFVSASRGVLVAHLGAHLLLLLSLRSSYCAYMRKSLLLWASGVGIFFLAKVFILPATQGFAVIEGQGRSISIAGLTYASDRLFLWERAIDLANSSPFFGIGPGRFALIPNSIAAAPHSSILSVASEWGWPIALILTTVCGWSIFCRTQLLARNYTNQIWGGSKVLDARLIGTFIVVSLLIESLVSTNVLLGPTSLVCLVIGVLLWLGGGGAGGAVFAIPWQAGALMFLIPAYVFGQILFSDFQHIAERNREYRQCAGPVHEFSPRFWQQGWLVGLCNKKP